MAGGSWRSVLGGNRTISALGGLYVVIATARALFVLARPASLLTALVDFALVGVPGLVLLYGGYRLPETDIDPDTYPRIFGWCLAGFGAVLVLIELLMLEPGVVVAYPRWSLTFVTALGSAGGFLVGAYDARALTRKRRLQEQRRQLQRQRQELQKRSDQLQRQNERLDNFANLLAHELRSPLAVAQIYLQQTAEGDRTAAEQVTTALTRIEEMVEIILVIARGSDADIDRESVALAEVAEDAWTALDVPNADLVVETDHTLVVNPVHLRHLLENLFTNAVEHADGCATVRVGGLPSGFYVEDDGPGIPESEREQVFEAGYTTDGIGFGLVFVAELADTYGWEYAITDGPDGGARFEFTDVDLVSTKEGQRH
ncbi:HAMP domain-containing sensor histidine kinase [Halorussus sp. MSC15.2]|uniref:sensor histidine kinase n=1 Tax=Halorussus sp. MSC15.2 TaxID=2283638 RepID=UPI0013D71934|nr:HAMP domain-containing sensor histidine kinase [Halorussus sp. MSC15.2]NEU56910.1 HAMP domain-containing histidine kinase [Halorussus sp. MSC15.2]